MVYLAHKFCPASHPLGAKIIFSYGMTKCGTTLAFELARTALELSGFPQPKIPKDILGRDNNINFCGHLTESKAKELEFFTQNLGHPLIVKTHTRPDQCVIDMINRGTAHVHAIYRDPREVALSMLDHGVKSRQNGKAAFSEIQTLDDALENIRDQIDTLTQWLYRKNCLPLYYQDIAFRMPLTTRKIISHLHISINEKIVIQHVLNKRFIQFNKGIKKRYKQEMSSINQRRIRQEFLPFYKLLIKNRSFLPSSGAPILLEGTVLLKTRGDTG